MSNMSWINYSNELYSDTTDMVIRLSKNMELYNISLHRE